MGSKPSKQKHIYDELNKSIDSFTSCDDYSQSDDNNKIKRQKRKSKNRYKLKFKLKKHKKIINNSDFNTRLIESSLLMSNFIINNIINKNIGERPLPDVNLLNSLLVYPDFFNNEGLELKNQKEYNDKMTFEGINNFIKEYKDYEKNKKKENKIYDYFKNNPVSSKKIFVNNLNYNGIVNEIDLSNNDNENNNDRKKSYDYIKKRNNKNFDYLYEPKEMKTLNEYEKYDYKLKK